MPVPCPHPSPGHPAVVLGQKYQAALAIEGHAGWPAFGRRLERTIDSQDKETHLPAPLFWVNYGKKGGG